METPFFYIWNRESGKFYVQITYPSHRSIVTFKGQLEIIWNNQVFQEVSAIPEVFFNGEFNDDIHFYFEVDLHGFFKVNFVFFLMETTFFTSAIDRAKNTTFKYVPKS